MCVRNTQFYHGHFTLKLLNASVARANAAQLANCFTWHMLLVYGIHTGTVRPVLNASLH